MSLFFYIKVNRPPSPCVCVPPPALSFLLANVVLKLKLMLFIPGSIFDSDIFALAHDQKLGEIPAVHDL